MLNHALRNDIAPRGSTHAVAYPGLPSFSYSLRTYHNTERRLAFQRRANATAQIEAEEAMQAQRAQQIVSW